MSHATVPDLLRERAESTPDDPLFTLLDWTGEEEAKISFRGCYEEASGLAGVVAQRAAPGDRVLILTAGNESFLRAFFACQLAATIGVPVYPPLRLRSGSGSEALSAIIGNCDPSLVLTDLDPEVQETCRHFVPASTSISWLTLSGSEKLQEADLPRVTPGDISFLQYTSGSTSLPRGVVVTHEALLAQQEVMRSWIATGSEDVGVSWLPLFHDMGLIGNVVHPLYAGAHAVLMSPLAFIKRPVLWLQAISRYRATISGGPNFAYELCLRRTQASDLAELDLSTWRVAFVGAEPVRVSTLEAFAERFASQGFERRSLTPCYGLAEATLLAAGADPHLGPTLMQVDAASLEDGWPKEGKGRTLVSSGRDRLGQGVAIVDPDSRSLVPEGRVGEIWLRGERLPRRYWGDPEKSEATFAARLEGKPEAGRYLRTGDLGFLLGDELFVTGRLKDLLIVAGKNHYPQDVEGTVEACCAALRPGCCAAFSIYGAMGEQVCVMAELKQGLEASPAARAETAQKVRQAVSRAHGIQVAHVALVPSGTIPKTSSGKIRRSACRSRFHSASAEAAAGGSA